MQITSRKRRARRTGCLSLALTSAPVRQELSLNDLASEELAHNAEIQAPQKHCKAARQRPNEDSSLPDPVSSSGRTSNRDPLPGTHRSVSPTSAIGICPRGTRASRGHSKCEVVIRKNAVAVPGA